MNKNSKAFTLIELLAVIVVLAILALIAIPIVDKIIKSSEEKNYKRSIETYGGVFETIVAKYEADNLDQEDPENLNEYVNEVEKSYKGNRIKCDLNDENSKIEDGKLTLIKCAVYESLDSNKPKSKYYNYINGKLEEYKKKETAVEILLKKANAESVTAYTDGDIHEMYTFTHDATSQTEALTDYRYIGNDPYNYVRFNNELWRIIGIFEVEDENGNKEQRIKIIRNESLGNMAWDSSNINEWTTATLQTYLNGDYYNSLNDEAKRVIASSKYYLGGRAFDLTTHFGTATDIYTWERETPVYSGRSTNWIGKIGLMYPSDYAYTYAKGVDDKCYTDIWDCYTSTPTKGWLYNSAYQWLISPRSDNSYTAFYVNPTGLVNNYSNGVSDTYGVRPSIYLTSGIGIEEGTGTQSDPYILK